MSSAGTHYRLLVFDWDGTLEDSAEPIVRSIEHTLQLIGKTPPPAHTIRRIIGLSLVEGLAELYPEDDAHSLAKQCRLAVSSAATHSKAAQSKAAQSTATVDQSAAHLFADTREVLQQLTQQGIWLAVATGKSRRGLDHALRHHALETAFMTTRTADDARSKPHPEMLLSILDELGVMPREALMVGDTSFDLHMAKAAGVDCVAVTYGVHSVATLESVGHAKACVDSLPALYPYVFGAGTGQR